MNGHPEDFIASDRSKPFPDCIAFSGPRSSKNDQLLMHAILPPYASKYFCAYCNKTSHLANLSLAFENSGRYLAMNAANSA